MGEPARKYEDIQPDIRPNFNVIQGGGKTTPGRASLKVLNGLESNPEKSDKGSILDQEANGSNLTSGSWKNDVTSAVKTVTDLKKGKINFKGLKGKQPAIIILILIAIATLSILFMSSTSLPLSIYSNLIEKFNTRETSLTIRANRIIASRLSDNITTGSCDWVKIACKYKKPSNKLLEKMEKNGIIALDSNGNAIKRTGLVQTDRPVKYKFTKNNGDVVEVEAKDFYKIAKNDSELMAAFHKAYNPRFMSLSDKVYSLIKTRFGIKSTDSLKDAKDTKTVKEIVDKKATVDNNGVKAVVESGDSAAIEKEGEKIITDEVEEEAGKVGKAGKGNAVGLAAGIACMASDIPGVIVKANRELQITQLIRYSSVFLTTFGAIKAGDATDTEVSTIGNILTETKNGKSSTDSLGIQYITTGKTTSDNNYSKFSAGASVANQLKSVTNVTDSVIKKDACAVATNPATGLAIDAATSETLIGPILNTIIGTVVANGISYALGTDGGKAIIEHLVSLIPIESILTYFAGDLTTNLSGEDVGNALVSGASQLMSQTANAGGNMPLTVTQAVAYNKTSKEVQLAYAKEDQATLSPLDISSPNTILGSIVYKLSSYFTSSSSIINSIKNNFGSIFKIIGSSFSVLTKPLTAAADSTNTDEYKLCQDTTLTNQDIATGPFCNIVYGIPTEYINEDPNTVIKNLIASGDIDEEGNILNKDTLISSADSQTSLYAWKELCTDGKSDQADNCKITSQKIAEYALYIIDSSIIEGMDNE